MASKTDAITETAPAAPVVAPAAPVTENPFKKTTPTNKAQDANLVGALTNSRNEWADGSVSWYEVPLSYFQTSPKQAEGLVRNLARILGFGCRVDTKTEGVIKFAATPPRVAAAA